MTSKSNKDNKKGKFSWFFHLLEALNNSNLTRSQKGNYIFDGLAVIAFIAFLFTNTEGYLKAVCFITLLISGLWCHHISLPRSNR